MKYLKFFNENDIPFVRNKGIYKIWFNQKPNDFYIGSAVSDTTVKKTGGFYSRISNHLQKLRKQEHFNIILQSYFDKYKEENLKFEIVEIVSNDINVKNIEFLETNYIKEFSEKFKILNIKKEARSSIGIRRRNTTKDKVSLTKSKNWLIFDRNGKFIKYEKSCNLIKQFNTFSKQKNYNYINNEIAFKNKITAEKYFSFNNKKIFTCFDLDGNKVKQFRDINEIVTFLNIVNTKSFSSNIYLYSKLKTPSHGYIWVYDLLKNTPSNLEIYQSKHKRIKVYQYDLDGNFLTEFDSQKEAEEKTGIDKRLISKALLTKTNISKGFIWKTN